MSRQARAELVPFRTDLYMYTTEHYASERKKEFLPFTTAWMELKNTVLSEISQAVKDKYHMFSPLTGT